MRILGVMLCLKVSSSHVPKAQYSIEKSGKIHPKTGSHISKDLNPQECHHETSNLPTA